MSKIKVKNAHRKTRRDVGKVFSDNFMKILTEIVLNADDSYKRLEHETGSKRVKEIVITLNRDDREVRVLDNAEGMSLSQMETIFGEYGGDYSGSNHSDNVRGLFGQGAADVMFNAAMNKKMAQIESIKNDVVTKCKFYFNKDKEIDVKTINPHMKQYRVKTGIIENGTLVTFGLPDTVKIPKQKDIKDRLESFYMFRYVFSNPLRKVVLIDGSKRLILNSKKYLIDEDKLILNKKKILLPYDDHQLTAFLTLYEKDPAKDTKIVIRDDNHVVYDDTMFTLDNLPGANLVAGELVIPKIAQLLRDLLNAEYPKELLTDTRDGFDGREEFTKTMNKRVGNVLEKAIEKNNSKRDTIAINLNHNKRFNEIMKKINTYYSDLELSSIEGLNPGDNPPNDGLKFARASISITKGKSYALKLYINPKQIYPQETITISTPNNDAFTIENQHIYYEADDIKDGMIVVKSIVIKATQLTNEPIAITASCKSFVSDVLVSVVEEKIIYPKNGLEFVPKRKTIKPQAKTSYKLYFDTDFIPLNSTITVRTSYDMKLLDETTDIQLTKDALITENIGALKVSVDAGLYEERIILVASYQDIITSAVLYVRIKEREQEGSSGFLNKIELRYDDEDWQTSMAHTKGVLYINGKHPININIMGNLGQKAHSNPTFKKEQRKYLYELIALESAKRIVKELITHKHIQSNPDTIFTQIQKHKTMIYNEIAEF